MNNFRKIKGGITSPKGFEASSCAAGIRRHRRKDMALVYSQEPCKAAGMFTKNIVKASPVLWDKALVDAEHKVSAVVVNSGIANACTGELGLEQCERTAKCAAETLGVEASNIAIASTGVIGKQLPIDKICRTIPKLVKIKTRSIEAGNGAAKAIMTTDTVEKEIAVELKISGEAIRIGAMAKGSGMIHPDMCTMLCFISTDANISVDALDKALRQSVEESFHMVSIDGDTSTNDTVLLLANSMARNKEIVSDTSEFNKFSAALEYVCIELAKMIAADGEGAMTLFEVEVEGAASKKQARILAKTVVCSSLVKTSIAGHDANWGRILCAMGYSGAGFDTGKVDLKFCSKAGDINIAKNGIAIDFNEDKATEKLSQGKIKAKINLHSGAYKATAWGCDLTHGYIRINRDYRT
ncbi:MAG: bifunctional glutamate N-acetyltransferase/amino-acid acetyltransferase ArgJ [Eggerthellaceae bacterium]|nr:bifunctional glutamate N-acetyltransferase/amino-acid acetyltransferase ArgJ [Eggerthellaceae bacterium]